MKARKHKRISLTRWGFPLKASIAKKRVGPGSRRPDYYIQKKDEWDRFAKWVALPSPLRTPRAMEDWGELNGVSKCTLGLWKKRPEFWEVVAGYRKEWAKDKTSDVISGLFSKASRGQAPEVKLWFQLIEDWSEQEAPTLPSITIIGIKGMSPEKIEKIMPGTIEEGQLVDEGS